MRLCFGCSGIIWPWQAKTDVNGRFAHKKCARVWSEGYKTAWMYLSNLYQDKKLPTPRDLVQERAAGIKGAARQQQASRQ